MLQGQRFASDDTLREVLARTRRIAIIGLSPRPHRDSHRVAQYLQSVGYRIVPVHPEGGTVLGEPVHVSVAGIPDPDTIDLVDVFRRPDALPDLVEELAPLHPPLVWLQLGVVHEEAEARALDLGMNLVVDRCLLVEHRRLMTEERNG
jgi:predicted CoA-binding protein